MNNAFTALLVAFPAYLLYRGKLTEYLKLAGGSVNTGKTADISKIGSEGIKDIQPVDRSGLTSLNATPNNVDPSGSGVEGGV